MLMFKRSLLNVVEAFSNLNFKNLDEHSNIVTFLIIFIILGFEGAIHFNPRALPSVGALPFIQSLYCNYRVDEVLKDPQELPQFASSM